MNAPRKPEAIVGTICNNDGSSPKVCSIEGVPPGMRFVRGDGSEVKVGDTVNPGEPVALRSAEIEGPLAPPASEDDGLTDADRAAGWRWETSHTGALLLRNPSRLRHPFAIVRAEGWQARMFSDASGPETGAAGQRAAVRALRAAGVMPVPAEPERPAEGLTDAQIAEIEARANAATPGPWSRNYQGKFMAPDPLWPGEPDMVTGVITASTYPGQEGMIFASDEDAAFIASARSDIPALLAEIRRLKAKIADIEAAHREQIRRADEIAGVPG